MRRVLLLLVSSLVLSLASGVSADGRVFESRVKGFELDPGARAGAQSLASADVRLGNRAASTTIAYGSPLASRGAVNFVPLLTKGPGRAMLGEAMGILKATPAVQRVPMARELLSQVSARATGGAWKATEMAGANGARAWMGDTHTMVIDAAGRVFSGPHVGGAVQFGVVEGEMGVTAWTGLKQLF